MSEIHSQAIISPRARLGDGVHIGAYAVIGDDVELGEGCVVQHHAVVQGPARLGRRNQVYSFAVIGGDPQDLTFAGERVSVEIGDENIFREFCTVNRGTAKGGGTTRLGNQNLIMTYAHIGHDDQIGSHTVFVNGATLGGARDRGQLRDDRRFLPGASILPHRAACLHCGEYGDHAGRAAIFENCGAARDALLWLECRWARAAGFSAERIAALEKAYRLLLRSKLNTTQAVAEMRETLNGSADVIQLIDFIESAERGLTK